MQAMFVLSKRSQCEASDKVPVESGLPLVHGFRRNNVYLFDVECRRHRRRAKVVTATLVVRFFAICISGLLLSVGVNASETADPENAPVLSGAELNWTMSCRGCHGSHAEGTEGGAPNMAGQVSRFLKVEGGRQYLVRVPGVAFANLSDSEVAELLNWMLENFDKENIPDSFSPYDEKEVSRLRGNPLITSVAEVRRKLILKMQ